MPPANSFWIIGVILGCLQLISILVSFTGYFFIRFNDLKHLSIDVKAIKESQEKEDAKLAKLEIGQATQKAICDERSSMYKLNKKVRAIKNRT